MLGSLNNPAPQYLTGTLALGFCGGYFPRFGVWEKQFALSQLLFNLAHCLKYNPQRLFEIFLERGGYNDIRNCNLNDHSVEVYQASWWAGMYGAMTWKRHVAWSCCPTIQCLDLGTLCKKFKRHIAKYGIKSTKQCKTHNGKKKGFCGSKHLKSTGMLG